MIVNIKASCPACGSVEFVSSPSTVLMVCTTDPDTSFFSFTCPGCGDLINRAAPTAIVALLVNIVPVRHFAAPPVRLDAPLTEDDLIGFGLGLHDDRAFDLSELA